MTFHYTDPDGDHLHVTPTTRYGKPALNLRTERRDGQGGAAVDIPASQLEDVIDGLRRIRRQAAGAHPGIRPLQPKPEPTAVPGSSALLQLLTDALTAEHYRRAQAQTVASPEEHSAAMAAAAMAVVLPTTRLTAELHQSAEADVRRVTTLYERWRKLNRRADGRIQSRWWEARLVELHAAILPPTEH